MRASLLLVLAGCALQSPEPQLTLAPPVQIDIGPAIPGQMVEITLNGIPDGVQLAAAIAGSESTACDLRLLGQCTDLGQPSVRGTGTSANGSGTVQVPLPSVVPVGTTLYAQVAGKIGQIQRISAVVEFTAEAAANSCGEVQAIADGACIGCHGAANTFGELDLRDISDAVGTPSAVAPMDLVTAGDADNSYLIHKLEGTHLSVGGDGLGMPLSGPLDAADIALFRTWIDDGAVCDGSAAPTGFTCDPTAAPGPTPMRRLSDIQYRNALADAIWRLGGQWLTDAVDWYVFSDILGRVPEDRNERDLSRQDQTVSLAHTEGWYLAAETIADFWIRQNLPCSSAACVPDFIDTVGARIQRRPMSTEQHDFYLNEVYNAASTHTEGMRDLAITWLAGPYFTHQVEHGDPSIPTGHADTVALTAHELAARLSLHVWNGPPDDVLWAAAEDGSLLNPAVYAQQVNRLFDAPESQGAREQFFTDWLHIDDVPPMHWAVGGAAYDDLRGSINPVSDLHERVSRDALDLLEWHVRSGNPLDELWTNPANTVLDPEVAALYETSSLWDGVSDPSPLTTGHGGLLTRPAFHVTGNTSTRPIHKGVLIRRRVLCDTLGDPPADLGETPWLDPALSQRERTEILTEQPGSICESCHTQINGLGYLTEGIDSLGRVRTTERTYNWDGTLLATLPIDDSAVAQVDLGDDTVLTGPAELGTALAASDKPDICVTRWWFRHTYSREEDDAVDGCVLQDIQQRLSSGDSLDSALRASALSDSFRVRRLDEGVQP